MYIHHYLVHHNPKPTLISVMQILSASWAHLYLAQNVRYPMIREYIEAILYAQNDTKHRTIKK